MTSAREMARDLWRTLQLEQGGSDFSTPTIPFDLDIGHGPVRLARSDDGNPRLLIPCGEPPRLGEPFASFGFATRSVWFVVSGRPVTFIEVSCRVRHLQEVFLSLIDDILRRLRKGIGPEMAIGQAISEYRDLLRRESDHSLETLVGLFGELAVLEALQAHNANAALAWTGPLMQRHDFSGPLACAEVKSTLQRDSMIVHVASVDQLEPPDDVRPLYLVFQSLERTGAAGRSVRELIESVRQRAGNPDVVDRALARLAIEDWQSSPAIAGERFRICTQSVFEVRTGFPRIGADSFRPGMPPAGVSGIRYDVDLHHASTFRVRESEVPRIFSMLASAV